MTDRLLAPQEVADRLGISLDFCYRLMARKEIAVTKVGRLNRVTEASLDAYIAEKTCAPRKSRKGAAA